MSEHLDLLDYRRRVAETYRAVRSGPPSVETWRAWVVARDDLFANHPQTALEDPSSFTGIPYFDYDADWRTTGTLTPTDAWATELGNSGSGTTGFLTAGSVSFELAGRPHELQVLWLNSYGGGIFLPFRDLTNGRTTYSGGRYLLDTAKGADLGHSGDELILDFNYAYHPSCVHSYRWSCPLAPATNHLDVEVTAGERLRIDRAE